MLWQPGTRCRILSLAVLREGLETRRCAGVLGAGLCFLGCGLGLAASEQPQRLAAEPAAIVPLAGESRLVVEKVAGRILIRAGKAGELRYLSLREEGREGAALEVWKDGRELRLRPPEGDEATRRKVEISVPADFDVALRADDSETQISEVGGVAISGRKLDFAVRRAKRVVELEAVDSRGEVVGVAGGVALRLQDSALELRGVEGEVYGHAAGGQIAIQFLGGPLDLKLQDTRLAAQSAASTLRLRASGGEVVLEQIQRGAELSLRGTPLRLKGCRGSLDIETDNEVRFADCDAAIHVNSWGGDLVGAGNTGLVEIRTHNARVALERISGPVGVQGEGLEVDLRGIEGELVVLAKSSEVRVAAAMGPVHIENDFGNVSVENVSGKLRIVSRDGEVSALQLKAPAVVSADGERVTVGWASLQTEEDSRIVNERGDVTVHLPGPIRCRVEARARFGRIETDLPAVRVSEDGTQAQGPVNFGRQPIVTVEAAGDIRLLGSARQADEGS